MEDSIALARAFEDVGTDVAAAFQRYERERRPIRDKLNTAAVKSIAWYETVDERLHLPQYEFAYSDLGRTGVITPDRLEQESPELVAATPPPCSHGGSEPMCNRSTFMFASPSLACRLMRARIVPTRIVSARNAWARILALGIAALLIGGTAGAQESTSLPFSAWHRGALAPRFHHQVRSHREG